MFSKPLLLFLFLSKNVLLLNAVLTTNGNTNIPILRTPRSIASMMNEVAISMQAAKENGILSAFIEFPLPVTGGTELDDWPGGIQQKYNIMRQLLEATMNTLQFTPEEIARTEYLGECGEEDSVGYWLGQTCGYQICCFPTTETIPAIETLLQKYTQDNNDEIEEVEKEKPLLVMVNQNFFVDPLSSDGTKSLINRTPTIYQIENLNMKGLRGMSIRGLLYMRYPGDWQVGRRLDTGGYELIDTLENKPDRKTLDDLFYRDSQLRDKDLSFFDRLKKQIPRY